MITIDVPVPPDAYEIIGNKPADPMAANMPPLLKPGAPWVICITPPPHQFLYTADAFPGRIYKLTLDGKVVGMLGKAGRQLKQFGWIHGMACPSENTLLRRRSAELAGAETDPASGKDGAEPVIG